MDCYTGVGAQYRGHKGKSEHSKTCQNWENIDFPRPGSKYKEGYNWAGIGDHRLNIIHLILLTIIHLILFPNFQYNWVEFDSPNYDEPWFNGLFSNL